MNKIVRNVLIGAVVLFVLIQFVPYGWGDNPPVVKEPNWDSSQTRELAVRACFDCHSNESKWPLYSNVAPLSWWIYHHVEDGREHLNFSDWGNRRPHGREAQNNDPEHLIEEIIEVMKEGEMPLPSYLPLHPEAELTPAEMEQLINGLAQTVRNSPESQ
ncbi:MAG: heme-binding domain-containing protein [Ardenticatenaceae bacterium]